MRSKSGIRKFVKDGDFKQALQDFLSVNPTNRQIFKQPEGVSVSVLLAHICHQYVTHCHSKKTSKKKKKKKKSSYAQNDPSMFQLSVLVYSISMT